MRRAAFGLLAAVAAAACGFEPGAGETPPVDGDAAGTPDACVGWSAQLDTCRLPAAGPLTLSGMLDFDTTSGELVDASGPIATSVPKMIVQTRGAQVYALIASELVIAPGTTLRVHGERGFALFAARELRIGAGAVIDAGATGIEAGPGARDACPGAPDPGQARTGGGAGGGGAGGGAKGGEGGDGNSDGPDADGGDGGELQLMPTGPAGPIGGCPGAAGGNTSGGRGGHGGGAVLLSTGGALDIAVGAGIRVGGGGGRGGASGGDAGGGGGGAGGTIWLEAALVRSGAVLAANGGGGGEGSNNSAAGNPGGDGALTLDAAPGGTGGADTGAAGALGGHLAKPEGSNGPAPLAGGGGGGGGAVGWVVVHSLDAQLGAEVSPAVVMATP